MPQYQGVWTLPVAARLQSTQQWATDPLYRNTTLLLQADNAANGAQNNTFLDSSSNNFTITRNGNTTQGTFTPYSLQPGAWGNYFSGAGSYLSNTSAALVGSTVSTFTAEAWIYMTAAPTSDANNIGSVVSLDGQANGTFNYMAFGPISNQRLFLRWFDGVGKTCNGSTVLALNTWYHIAVVVNSNAISMYVNGLPETLSGTTTLTNRNGTSNEFAIATNNYTSFSGYISNVRVTNTAVYTSAFTPSTIPLTSPSGTLLLTCQSNRFVDTNTQAAAKTLTPAGSATSVQAFSPFAPQYQYTPSVTGGSGYFDGTGDRLGIATDTALDLTGDFTFECWIYPTVLNTYHIIFDTSLNGTAGANMTELWIVAPNSVEYYVRGSLLLSGTGVVTNSWQHVALTKSGTTQRLFLNGVIVASTTSSTQPNTGYTWAIGDRLNGAGSGQYPFTGNISNLRILKGTALYTSNFTPPTAPLTAIANTSLLLNFTNAGIYDGTMKNNLETVGNAQVSTSVVKYGTGSMYFDGTGDYLKGNQATSNLYVLEGDFTIEMWVYSGSFVDVGGAYPTMYATSTFSGTGIGVKIQSAGGSGVSGCACVWYNGSQILTGTTNIANSTWTHVAVSRINGFMRLFVNGTQQASTTNTATFTVSSGYPLIGADTTSTGTLNGYIDDLRITKGIARYTANFTPPTVALPRQ